MAFKINDERAPLDQFLQGESVRAYEFLGSHFAVSYTHLRAHET